MNIVKLIQGSPEWLAHRAKCFNASDAPAMLGVSKHKKRTDLLKELSTGIMPEIDPATQRRFDAGHAAEEAARPIVEAILGEELFRTTGTEEVDGMTLSASFDGITMLGDLIWENKLLNGDLKEAVIVSDLPAHYWAQLEHQLLVSGAEQAYFTTSDGTEAGTHGTLYHSVPERRAKVIAGWKQFAEDLANYQHVEAQPEAVAAVIEALPALMVQVEGKVLATNLDVFKEKASAFIANIKTELATDQDFVDAVEMVRFLDNGVAQLKTVKAQAQAQAADIDQVFRAIDAISEEMRQKRLTLEKLVMSEKDKRKAEIINTARWELASHMTKLGERIGIQMPPIQDRFAEAIKGKKTVSGMQDAVSTALANHKIEANEIADRIEINKKAIDAVPDEYAGLFADLRTILLKEPDDLKAIVYARIEDHKAAVAKRQQEEEARRQRDAEAQRQREAAAQAQQPASAALTPEHKQARHDKNAQATAAVEKAEIVGGVARQDDRELASLKWQNKALRDMSVILMDALEQIIKESKKGSKAHTIASEALSKVTVEENRVAA